MGGRFQRKGTYVYLWLIHDDVWQKQSNIVKWLSFSWKKKICLPMQETRVPSLVREPGSHMATGQLSPCSLNSTHHDYRAHMGQLRPDTVQSCPTLCDPMDCSTPGFPVHHQLLELAQTHIHRVGDAIQPSRPLSSPSSTLSLSQHQGLFQLEFQLQHQFFQWLFRADLL